MMYVETANIHRSAKGREPHGYYKDEMWVANLLEI